jgi:hypothetical protein
MALKSRVFDNLLHFASTSRSRSAVTFAAVSFAICQLIVMATASSGVSAELDAEVPRQLIHLGAELCQFTFPLGFMVSGVVNRAKKAPPRQIKR